MSKRIAVITMGVKLGKETKGYTRFVSVCEALRAAEFEVDLITTSFQHWEKAHRDTAHFPKEMHDFGIVFIDEPGYRRNVDLRRIRSHAVAARNLADYLEHGPAYDLIYCEVPPNDVALAAAKHAERRGIPFVADINDLWPEAMRMVLDVPLVSTALFRGLERDAREVYRRVSAVVGTSDEYSARPFTDCPPETERLTVYVGNDLEAFDRGVREYGAAIERNDDEFIVTYAGTVGTSYDIETLIRAVSVLEVLGYDDVRLIVLGDGPDLPRLRELAEEIAAHVDFRGYVPYPVMAAWLSRSDVLVNSLVKKAPQSIVTKIGDYLAAGKPMINTGSSPEFRSKVNSDGFGVNVEAEQVDLIAQAIMVLHDDDEARKAMGAAARLVAEHEFDRKVSYKRIADLVSRLTQ